MKQITTNQVVESRDRRIAKGMVVAVSCKIVKVEKEKETYKVQSETDTNKYYIVKFMDGTPVYCSYKDFEMQSQKNRNHVCKHQRAIVVAENYGLVIRQQPHKQKQRSEEARDEPKSYKDDEYSF